MSEYDEEEVEVSGIESKFNRVALTITAMLLMFVGPTYVPYFISDTLSGTYYVLSAAVGAAIFIVGLVLLVYLIRKKVIS
jgi:hypothetical protein